MKCVEKYIEAYELGEMRPDGKLILEDIEFIREELQNAYKEWNCVVKENG